MLGRLATIVLLFASAYKKKSRGSVMIENFLKKWRELIRKILVNNKNIRNLKCTDFSIISSDCTGGVLSHDLNLQFLSPTINMFFSAQDMSECYAMYLNHKYSYRGHVFESRYKSCLVKEDAYFLQTSRYIHLNPVKAQMTNYSEDYPWSSYQTMIGLSDDRITEKKKTLAYFPKNSIFRYREFVEDIGHKYIVQEQQIRKMMGEDELWLPW